jgi:cytochrome c oxidase subunit IV
MSEKVATRSTYVWIWAVLICLTALTATVSFIDLHRWSTVVAFLIATIINIFISKYT